MAFFQPMVQGDELGDSMLLQHTHCQEETQREDDGKEGKNLDVVEIGHSLFPGQRRAFREQAHCVDRSAIAVNVTMQKRERKTPTHEMTPRENDARKYRSDFVVSRRIRDSGFLKAIS